MWNVLFPTFASPDFRTLIYSVGTDGIILCSSGDCIQFLSDSFITSTFCIIRTGHVRWGVGVCWKVIVEMLTFHHISLYIFLLCRHRFLWCLHECGPPWYNVRVIEPPNRSYIAFECSINFWCLNRVLILWMHVLLFSLVYRQDFLLCENKNILGDNSIVDTTVKGIY